MKSPQINITHQQLNSFKSHATELNNALASFNANLKLSGRRRVDFLARCCGYNNHSDLCNKANKKSRTDKLVLFSPDHARILGKAIAKQHPQISFDLAIAAIVKSSAQLYESREDRWTVGHLREFGDGAFQYLMPRVNLNFAHPFRELLLATQGIGKAIRQFSSSPLTRQMREFANSPGIRHIQKIANNPAMRNAQVIANSPAMRMAQEMANSPAIRMAQKIANNPAVQLARQIAKDKEET